MSTVRWETDDELLAGAAGDVLWTRYEREAVRKLRKLREAGHPFFLSEVGSVAIWTECARGSDALVCLFSEPSNPPLAWAQAKRVAVAAGIHVPGLCLAPTPALEI